MLSKFSVKKPYTVIVGVVLIIILGVVSFGNMTVDLLPSMNLPYVIVMTTYQGASPEVVEGVVTRPIEQTMATVSNIKNVQSTSSENASTVMLEFDQAANMDAVIIEMRESLDQISGYWTEEVTSPIIMKMNPSMMPVLITAVNAGGKSAAEATKIIEGQVLPEVESVEGVASVSASGSIEERLQITLNPHKVSEFNDKVFAQFEQKFQEASQALTDAKVQVESGKIALEEGKAQASLGLAAAEAEVSIKSEEIKQAQLEIAQKIAELEVSNRQIQQSLAQLQSSKAATQAQLTRLETSKASYDQMSVQYQELKARETELTEPEKEEMLRLETQLASLTPVLAQYDETKAMIQAGLQQVAAQEAQLVAGQGQLQVGREQLDHLQQQVNNGALTLAQARGQMASAQLEAAAGIGEGAAQLAAGDTLVQVQETQMESAKAEAEKNADMSQLFTPDMLKTILAAQNFNMPAGYVTESGQDYLVRVGEKFKTIEDINGLTLADIEGVGPVKISDVAEVKLVSNADESYAKINGQPGLVLSIQKQTGYSTGDVSSRVIEKLKTLEKQNNGIEVVTLMDQGVYIDLIVNSVLQNLVYGAILAIIILLVFLKSLRPTIVIACSIPISIMTAIVAMYFSGVTLNIISLSGLALGVGMLVDNSIVVIENIYRMRNEEDASAKEAAMEGARQVSGAITASTLTTICVFLPIVFATGITKQLFVDMGLTIAYSLLASLLIALTLVPAMSAGLLKKTQEKESRLFDRIREVYGLTLMKALRLKPLVLIGALLLFAFSGALAISRGTEFMPEMESTEVSLTLETKQEATFAETTHAADQVMNKVGQIKDIKDIGGLIGEGNMMAGSTSDNKVEFYAITVEKPSLSNKELKRKIEAATKDVNGEVTVKMSSMDMSALGSSGVNVQIKGKDLDKLQKIAKDVKEIISGIKGTQNVTDGTEDNKEELRVVVNKDTATKQGLTVAQVYQSLSAKLSEAKVATTLTTDLDDFGVYIVDDANETLTRDDIRNMTITAENPDGTSVDVKLSDVAAFEDASGLQAISRTGQSRYMTVTAELKEGDNIGIVGNKVNKGLKDYDAPEGYEITMTGEDQTINDAMKELFKMLALALVFMYLIMVAQFQSLRFPFIVMFTVPLAFTGGLLALWIAGKAVSVIAMVGFVMLSGIIVNNGIVFIDYTNQLIEKGMEKKEALVKAGQTRLRPIIMTALTTILGLSTMAIGVGMGSDMVQPMAIVTIGGLLYGTILTLIVVPCIFDLFHKKEKTRLKEGTEAND